MGSNPTLRTNKPSEQQFSVLFYCNGFVAALSGNVISDQTNRVLMCKVRKKVTLLILLTLSLSLLAFALPTKAQPIPTPSTPTFTVKLVDNSYTTPVTTTSSTDPYTNKTTVTQTGGQYIKNYTIALNITNQALPVALDSCKYSIYYSIRFMPHFAQDGPYDQYGVLSPCNNSLAPDPSDAAVTQYFANVIPKQSDGQYTIFSIDGNYYNQSDQIDFQVKAVVGQTFNYWQEGFIVTIPGGYRDTGPASHPAITEDSEGSWSTSQTLLIDYNSPTMTHANSDWIFPLIIVAVLGVAIASLLVYVRKSRNRQQKQ